PRRANSAVAGCLGVASRRGRGVPSPGLTNVSIAAVVVGAITAVALGLPRDEMHTNCGGDSTDRSIAAARGSSCQAVWDLINAGPRDWPSGRVIRLRVV